MKKALFLLIISGGVLFLFFTYYADAPVSLYREEEKEVVQPITITFVGDIMFDRGVRGSIEKNFSGEYGALFAHAPYLSTSDITFGNLEGPVATSGKNVGSRFSFRMDPKGLRAMSDAGFDVVSFANNHVGDYTQEAFEETLVRLTENSIGYSGAGYTKDEAYAPHVTTIRGTRVGILSFSDVGPLWMKAGESSSGHAVVDDSFESVVTNASEQVDVLIVSFHFGDEYSPVSARQRLLATKSIDAGATMVVGHHAHVIQAIEWYNGAPIVYGLGNFIFDQYFSLETMKGLVVTATIDPVRKEVALSSFVSEMNRQYIPSIYRPLEEADILTKAFRP